MSSGRLIQLAICLLITLPQQAHSTTPVIYSGSLTILNNDNISLGNTSQDIVSDNSVNLEISASQSYNINANSSVKLSGIFSSESFSKYSGLNNQEISAKAHYLFSFGRSFRSPTYGIYLKLGQANFNSDLRDNTFNETGLTFNMNLFDRTQLRALYFQQSKDADTINPGVDNYETFDSKRDNLYLSLNLKYSKQLSYYISTAKIDGDITANLTSATLDSYEQATASIRPAWETIPDTIFGPNRESTKYTASLTRYAVGLNYSHSSNKASDLLIEALEAGGRYGYDITRLSYNYMQRF